MTSFEKTKLFYELKASLHFLDQNLSGEAKNIVDNVLFTNDIVQLIHLIVQKKKFDEITLKDCELI